MRLGAWDASQIRYSFLELSRKKQYSLHVPPARAAACGGVAEEATVRALPTVATAPAAAACGEGGGGGCGGGPIGGGGAVTVNKLSQTAFVRSDVVDKISGVIPEDCKW